MLKFLKNGARQIEQAEKAELALNGTLLKEVEITGFKESVITNETWDANFVKKISEEDLKTRGRKSVYELLQESMPGFKLSRFWQTCGTGYQMHSYENFVIGSYWVPWIRIDSVVAGISLTKQFFTYILGEDIKEIAIYKGCSAYYLDITTRSGSGPWVDRPIGMYVYRPLPISIPKEFYQPKYSPNSDHTGRNFQATRFWDANIVTNEDGKATISFYRTDVKGSYHVKIEGADLNGRVGYLQEAVPL
ncbi:hypothetical protein D9M68_506110 [compost metagenome]